MEKRSSTRRKNPAQSDRRSIIVDAAAKQFSKHGYDGTTMRTIATESGILAGSLYYYFPSKEDMFLAVHEQAINKLLEGVFRNMNPDAEPWDRLLQASQGYLTTMLLNSKEISLTITEWPRLRTGKLRSKLIADRQRFEDVFRDIVADLPLEAGVDRRYWRLALMSMLAWTHIWYEKGGDSPKVVAENMINLLKQRTAAE